MRQRERIISATQTATAALAAYAGVGLLHRLWPSLPFYAPSAAILCVLFARFTSNTKARILQQISVVLFAALMALLPVGQISPGEFDYGLLALTIIASLLQATNSRAQALGTILLRLVILSLVVPAPFGAATHGNRVAVSVVSTVIALMCTWIAEKIWSRHTTHSSAPTVKTDARAFMKRPVTRRGLQLCAAVLTAIVIGQVFFPKELDWLVLSAFLVGAGATSRGHAVMKGVQRFLGACLGTIFGTLFAVHITLHGNYVAAVTFAFLFLTLYARTYAYWLWALGVTLILGLLHSSQPSGTNMLDTRLIEVAIGSACAVLTSYTILPIRTRDVFRKLSLQTLGTVKTAYEALESGVDSKEVIAQANQALTRLQKVARVSRLIGQRRHSSAQVLALLGQAVADLNVIASDKLRARSAAETLPSLMRRIKELLS